MAAVVEPIVTEEKLLGLLGEQCEQSVLDYKEQLDLSKREEIVEFAKDVAAMRSNPTAATSWSGPTTVALSYPA